MGTRDGEGMTMILDALLAILTFLALYRIPAVREWLEREDFNAR